MKTTGNNSHISEENTLHIHRCDNLKSYNVSSL